MKLLAAISLFFAVSVFGHGQFTRPPGVIIVGVAPSGSCTGGAPGQLVTGTGAIWTCQGGTWTAISGGGGGSSIGVLGAVQKVGATTGSFAQAVGDADYQSVSSTPLGGSQGSLQIISNSAIDQNQFQFTDGTTGWAPGPAYSGLYAEDFGYSVLMNPSKFTAASILNAVTKLVAAVDAHGVVPPAITTSGAAQLYSGFDANHAFTSGPGASLVGLLCYVYYQKTGSTSCYSTNVAALKTSQAFRPLNGSSHLPTVVVGANEYIPGSLFLEMPRFSGDIANASILLAAYDAAMLKMATAAGDATNVTFFTTNLSQVTTSIQAEFIDGTTHMLLGASGVDNQIDVLSSGMAVWFSQYLNTPILTLTQQKAIGTYLHTNLAAITHNGYFANTVASGAVTSWATQGQLPSGGGGSGYTNICSSTTTYQNGYWSLVTGMAAQALYLTNPTDVPNLLASFRDSSATGGGDPAQEYYTQAFGTASGGTCGTATTPNMESPQSASWAAANLVSPTPSGIGGNTDKYGALISGNSISTVGVGYWIPTAGVAGSTSGVTAASALTGTPNVVLVTQFVLPVPISVGQISVAVQTGIAASVSAIGIYDANGNKLVAADNFATATSSTMVNRSVGPVTLQPGVYYLAQSSTTSSVTMTALLTDANLNSLLNHNTVKRQASAANAMSGGVLPATLGALSATVVFPVLTLLEP